jgi:uncharacterized Zn finger protein (UPF0148 family)
MIVHEVYKKCCPKCSHVFFRLELEKAECPVCHEATGMTVAGGHFEADQTFVEMLEQEQEQEKQRDEEKRKEVRMHFPGNPSDLEEMGQKIITLMIQEFGSLSLTDVLYILHYVERKVIHYANINGWVKVNEKERAVLNQILVGKASAMSVHI